MGKLHFIDDSGTEQKVVNESDVDDTPANGATTDPISSNWAYDHENAADPHGAYYLEAGEVGVTLYLEKMDTNVEGGQLVFKEADSDKIQSQIVFDRFDGDLRIFRNDADADETLISPSQAGAGGTVRFDLTNSLEGSPSDGEVTKAPTSDWAYDHVAAADPHVGYVLESLFDADTFLYASSDNTPVATSPANVLAALTGHAGATFDWNTQNLTGVGTITAETSQWWHEYNIPAASTSPGASGATWVDPSATTLGGWNMDADGEHLDFQCHVEPDWDGATDIKVEVYFEKDTAGGSGGDAAIIKLDTYYKGKGDVTNKTQSLSDSVTVDDDARYTLYEAGFTIDWDKTDHNVVAGDVFGFHLWFDETNSDISDIIVNFIELKYQTKKPAPEV